MPLDLRYAKSPARLKLQRGPAMATRISALGRKSSGKETWALPPKGKARFFHWKAQKHGHCCVGKLCEEKPGKKGSGLEGGVLPGQRSRGQLEKRRAGGSGSRKIRPIHISPHHLFDQLPWIDGSVSNAEFKMQMRSCGKAAVSHSSDHLPCLYLIPSAFTKASSQCA